MQKQRKFTGKEKAVLAVLIIAMIAVVTVGAVLIVNNVNEANRKATDTQNTTVEITLPETTENNTTADGAEKGEKKSKTKSKAKSKTSSASSQATASRSSAATDSSSAVKSSASKSSSTKSKSSSTKSKSSASNGDKIPVRTPDTNSSHASSDVCTVNGVKCYVGDTITMTLNLKTPKVLVNYQGYTTFDDSKLKFVSSDSDAGALVNCKDGIIYYNASVLRGIDFTSSGTVYYAKFKVKKSGSVDISNTFQVLTDMDDNPVNEGKCQVGIEIFN